MSNKKIAIIGAGIVGVASAINLQREGHDLVLIDKLGPAEGTSFGNGGILVSSGVIPVNAPGLITNAPGMLLRKDSPLFMHWPYLPKMLPWLMGYIRRANVRDTQHVASALAPLVRDSYGEHQALAKGSGAEKWIQQSDYVFVYDDEAAFKKDAYGWSLRKEQGIEWDEFSPTQFSQYSSLFQNKGKFAVRLKNHGHLTDPGCYVQELAASFVKNGGQLKIAEVDEIQHADGRVSGIKTTSGIIPCDTIVIAAGVWSKSITEKLGLKIPMESERGYHIELINASIKPDFTMMLAAGKFVITPMKGRLRCAGIVEFGGLEQPASKAPIALLKSHIHALFPNIQYDAIEEWMGHRPAPIDSIPFIGAHPELPDIYTAFGHHHVGMASGPRTGRLISDLICNKEPSVDITPYRIERFTH